MSSAEKQRTYTHSADKSTIYGLNGIRSIQASPEVTLVMHHAPCTLHPASTSTSASNEVDAFASNKHLLEKAHC